MKPWITTLRASLPLLLMRFLAYGAMALCLSPCSQVFSLAMQLADSDLVVHEWGTFTSIAGKEGKAVDWLPFKGPVDLPGFVEHLRDGALKVGLRGTIRMETPVIYFHSSHEVRASVNVAFSRGVITEWYPHASRVLPTARLFDRTLYQQPIDGSISWDDVAVQPDAGEDFIRQAQDNRYYAARETSAAPLLVKSSAGGQREKFLFYRGVSRAPLPISAKVTLQGTLLIKNLSKNEIPNTLLFERREEKVGYRIGGVLQDETSLDPPELTGTVADLCRDLENILTTHGLYRDEAHAMVETWQSSWFEEGSRLLYIVPTAILDSMLPLTIHPTPAQTVRVFVGRIELVTPATERAIESALASHDNFTLAKYGRFVNPIVEMIESDPVKASRLKSHSHSGYRPDAGQ